MKQNIGYLIHKPGAKHPECSHCEKTIPLPESPIKIRYCIHCGCRLTERDYLETPIKQQLKKLFDTHFIGLEGQHYRFPITVDTVPSYLTIEENLELFFEERDLDYEIEEHSWENQGYYAVSWVEKGRAQIFTYWWDRDDYL